MACCDRTGRPDCAIADPAEMPSALFDYFAEELLQSSDRATQLGLCRLAVAPSITDASATDLLGPLARSVLAESVSAGILLPEGDHHFELHPLLRTFLQERLNEFGDDLLASTVARGRLPSCSRTMGRRSFSGSEISRPALLEDLIASAGPMLDEGRLVTLSSLADLAQELRLRSPLSTLSEAEIAFRQASYRTRPRRSRLRLSADWKMTICLCVRTPPRRPKRALRGPRRASVEASSARPVDCPSGVR